MSRNFVTLAGLAAVLALAGAGRAHAYGAVHTGATYVAPNGSVQHSGSTTGYGPGGAYSTSHNTYSGPGGTYGTASVTNAGGTTTAGTGGYRAYTPTAYTSYSPGGTCPTYTGSVYRYP